MKKIEFIATDIQVVLEDMQRKRQGIVKDCLRVWDSMGGKLPSFQGFCEMYMGEMFQKWIEKGKWN